MSSAQRKTNMRRDSLDDIAQYYKSNQEETRLEIQQLEYMITSRLFKKYLKPASRILEIGAGSGRYTLDLSRQGHSLTAIELVPELAHQIEDRLKGAKLSAEVLSGDARDVVRETQGTFDATLVMGPLYHLVKLEEQHDLMATLKTKTHRGSFVMTAHLTRIGLMAYMLARYPTWALESPKQVEQIMKGGYLWDHPRNGDFRGYFSTADEIRDLHEAQGLKVIQLHCQDPCIGAIDEIFSQLPLELKNTWADLLTDLSQDELALGSGRSLLCVSKA